jgi:hypothetical protein
MKKALPKNKLYIKLNSVQYTHTKSVTILLKILQKSLSDAMGTPIFFPMMRRHLSIRVSCCQKIPGVESLVYAKVRV